MLASGPFGGRGFCASSDAASHIEETGHCLSLADFLKPPAPPCANVAESPDMHADCIAASAEALPIARYYSPAFHAGLPPGQPENWAPVAPESANVQSWSVFAPYAHRTRLFRTPNDAYLIVNQRPTSYTDQTVPGLLDLARANGGAFAAIRPEVGLLFALALLIFSAPIFRRRDVTPTNLESCCYDCRPVLDE